MSLNYMALMLIIMYIRYVLTAPMVNMNASVEYEALKITDDGTSSTMSCTTTPGNVVVFALALTCVL